MVIKTYIPSNLCDSIDGSGSSDSSDGIDSSDQKTTQTNKKSQKNYKKNYKKNQTLMKLKNSNCGGTWNSNRDETQKLKL